MATKLSIDLQKSILLTFYPERPSIELEGAASAKDGKYIPVMVIFICECKDTEKFRHAQIFVQVFMLN
ncbi:MAG: hypothetical protein IJQ84_09260 [Paludibacteraceae bacterium]|nr:hypothetical protein [Paludibacteraceae bacterium]MBQ6724678.1 hypothetical protein [Paludibacteraceae bacterium]